MPKIAPGPSGNPITDQLEAFETDPLGFLEDARRAHGDVVRLRLWPQLCHLVAHPRDIERVLVSNRGNYHSRAASAPGGMALPTRRLGRMFHRDRLSGFAPEMSAAIGATLRRLDDHAGSGRPVDLAEEMKSLTLRILGRTVFAAGFEDARLPAVIRALDVAARYTAPQHHVSTFRRLVQSGVGVDPAVEEATRTLDGFVHALIQEGRRAAAGDEDLLSALVTDETLSEQSLWETVLVFVIAGHQTTASTLAWTFHLLAQHEDVRSRLEHELDAALGGVAPSAADMPRLPYTLMVLRESMRLYPPVWMLAPRRAEAADELGGYAIPRGSVVLVSPWVTHRHPDLWERPGAFAPHRFASSAAPGYQPFGAGPWACIGSQFALLEARLVLASLVQRYRWSPTSGAAVDAEAGAALMPRGGIRVFLERRG